MSCSASHWLRKLILSKCHGIMQGVDCSLSYDFTGSVLPHYVLHPPSQVGDYCRTCLALFWGSVSAKIDRKSGLRSPEEPRATLQRHHRKGRRAVRPLPHKYRGSLQILASAFLAGLGSYTPAASQAGEIVRAAQSRARPWLLRSHSGVLDTPVG